MKINMFGKLFVKFRKNKFSLEKDIVRWPLDFFLKKKSLKKNTIGWPPSCVFNV